MGRPCRCCDRPKVCPTTTIDFNDNTLVGATGFETVQESNDPGVAFTASDGKLVLAGPGSLDVGSLTWLVPFTEKAASRYRISVDVETANTEDSPGGVIIQVGDDTSNTTRVEFYIKDGNVILDVSIDGVLTSTTLGVDSAARPTRLSLALTDGTLGTTNITASGGGQSTSTSAAFALEPYDSTRVRMGVLFNGAASDLTFDNAVLSACGPTPTPEPCEPCTIEYFEDYMFLPRLLPEYIKLTIGLGEGWGECCGGLWHGGCWILRNAYAIDPSGGDEFKKWYYAVDPDNVDQILRSRLGNDDLDTCVGIDESPLIQVIFNVEANSNITDTFVDFVMAKMLTPSHPTDTHYYNFAYYYRSGHIDICDTAAVHTIDQRTEDGFLALCHDNGPPLEAFWDPTITLQAICPPFSGCNAQPGLCFDNPGCSPNILSRELYADISLDNPSTQFRVCLSCTEGVGWSGFFNFFNETCDPVAAINGSAEIVCESGQWKFKITANDITESYDLTVYENGTSGLATGTSTNLCGLSSDITISLQTCIEAAVACCPEWGCCPPNFVIADVTGNFMTGTASIRLYGDGSGTFTGSGQVQIGSLICGMAPVMKTLTLLLECVSGAWRLTITSDNDSATTTASSSFCDPFEADFSGMVLAPGTGCTDVTFAVSVYG